LEVSGFAQEKSNVIDQLISYSKVLNFVCAILNSKNESFFHLSLFWAKQSIDSTMSRQTDNKTLLMKCHDTKAKIHCSIDRPPTAAPQTLEKKDEKASCN
jgi:hypothetical protein